MKTIILTVIFLMSFLVIKAQDTFKADISKSNLNWIGEKVSGMHTGEIKLKSGQLMIKGDQLISGIFEIDMSSITCTDIAEKEMNQKLVGHLKSEDFFGVEKYPTAKLTIKKPVDFVKGVGIVKGDITIKGVTNPIEFKAVLSKSANDVNFYSVIKIDRYKFNIK